MVTLTSCSTYKVAETKPLDSKREIASNLSDIVDKIEGSKIYFQDGSTTVKIQVGQSYRPKPNNANIEELYSRVQSLEIAVNRMQDVIYNIRRDQIVTQDIIAASSKCSITGTYSDVHSQTNNVVEGDFEKVIYASGANKTAAAQALDLKVKLFVKETEGDLYLNYKAFSRYALKTKCTPYKFENN